MRDSANQRRWKSWNFLTIESLMAAHEVCMRWCGPEVEVEGIVSLKTGGCPRRLSLLFCSQVFRLTGCDLPWLDIPLLVDAGFKPLPAGQAGFCIVAAVRGPDETDEPTA